MMPPSAPFSVGDGKMLLDPLDRVLAPVSEVRQDGRHFVCESHPSPSSRPALFWRARSAQRHAGHGPAPAPDLERIWTLALLEFENHQAIR
ncbi:hypothetical protein SCOR_34465 [Sulfidibacter corallicola]